MNRLIDITVQISNYLLRPRSNIRKIIIKCEKEKANELKFGCMMKHRIVFVVLGFGDKDCLVVVHKECQRRFYSALIICKPYLWKQLPL